MQFFAIVCKVWNMRQIDGSYLLLLKISVSHLALYLDLYYGLMLILAFNIGDEMIFLVRTRTRNVVKISNHVDYVITADSRATLKSRQLWNYDKRKKARSASKMEWKKDVEFAKCGTEQRTASKMARRGGLNELGYAPNLNLHRRYLWLALGDLYD